MTINRNFGTKVYCKFPDDYYNEQKNRNRHFSYRYFAGKARIGAIDKCFI
jgi:hypothetical protein